MILSIESLLLETILSTNSRSHLMAYNADKIGYLLFSLVRGDVTNDESMICAFHHFCSHTCQGEFAFNKCVLGFAFASWLTFCMHF